MYQKTTMSDLLNRILFTVFCLIICRVGSYIPVPGIDTFVLSELAESNKSGILGMFNMLSGGSLERMSIFALAIMPYITASIILQLLSVAYKPLEELKKEGETGRRKINQYTRYLTVFLAGFQAYGMSSGLTKMSTAAGNLVVIDPAIFKFTATTTLVVGTIFLMWLGEQISSRGIGNGISLIIFVGIVSGLPASIARVFELAKAGSISSGIMIMVLALIVVLLGLVILFERAQRKVLVQYPKRQIGMKVTAADSSHIPFKLNTAGVIPPIFASSLLLFPLTIAKLSGGNSEISDFIAIYLGHGKPLYILASALLIVFFSFFYTSVVFNPEETAKNLKKNGAYIPGRRPGQHTSDYFEYLLTRLTVLGSAYLVLVCVIPEILTSRYSIPFTLGGTSLIILVNVVIDTTTQIQTHIFSSRYEGLVKKFKLRDKRR